MQKGHSELAICLTIELLFTILLIDWLHQVLEDFLSYVKTDWAREPMPVFVRNWIGQRNVS